MAVVVVVAVVDVVSDLRFCYNRVWKSRCTGLRWSYK